MKKNFKKTLAAAVGCVALLGSMLFIPAQADNGPTVVADNRTLNTWDSVNMAKDTQNVGRIWTDKSVSADAIELKYGASVGTPIAKSEGSDFIIALSALSSTSTATTVTDVPLNVVMVLDRSGSMDDDLVADTYTEVYDLDTSETYYIQTSGMDGGTSYRSVTYSNGNWRYRSGSGYTNVTPMTSATDNTSGRYQFYSLVEGMSKLEGLQAAAKSFITHMDDENQGLADYMKHSMAIVSYAEGATTNADWTTNATTLTNAINNLNGNGQTEAHQGMARAQSVLESIPVRYDEDGNVIKAANVVVFFTDGEPNESSGFWPSVAAEVVNRAKEVKDGGTLIYSVAVYSDANVADEPVAATGNNNSPSNINYYLHAVSSNYPDAEADTSGLDDEGNYRHSRNSTWQLNPGTRVADGSYYKVATDSVGLNSIFDEIFDEITAFPASPTVTDSGAPAASGYITFTDKLGDYMEFKAPNGIVYVNADGQELYTEYTASAPVTNSEGKTEITYSYTGTVTAVNKVWTDESGYPLSNLIIKVTKGATAQEGDTVTVQIPSALLPLRHYDVDKEGNLVITEATPVRVLYSVGLKTEVENLKAPGTYTSVAEAMASGKLDTVDGLAEYASSHADDQGVFFHANWWVNDETAERGDTYVEFTPAQSNNYYYYTENTYLYADADCTIPVTSLPAYGTYYYQHTYYVEGDTIETFNSIAVEVTEANQNVLVQDEDGYYIPRGTTKISMANDDKYKRLKPGENAALNVGGTEAANATDTADYYLYPTWLGSNALDYLGNNGRITYNATGALEITKTVTPGEVTAPDAAFTFEVAIPNGAYSYVVTDAQGNVVPQDATDENGNLLRGDDGAVQQTETPTLHVSGGKATLELKDGWTATIYGIAEGSSYTVTETKVTTTVTTGEGETAATEEVTVDMPGSGFNQTAAVGTDGTIATGVTSEAAFTNAYTVTPVTFPAEGETAFPVRKNVVDADGNTITEWEEDWSFTFTLFAPEEGTPMPDVSRVTVNAENYKNDPPTFGSVTYTKPGTYTYGISEMTGNTLGISYSAAQYTVVIEIVDNGDGTMTATPTMTKVTDEQGNSITAPEAVTEAVFTNPYVLETALWSPEAYKNLENQSGDNRATLQGSDFTFTAELVEVNGVAATDADKAAAPQFADTQNTQGGIVIFPQATLTSDHVGNTYLYVIREVNDNKTGVNYTEDYYYVKLEVASEDVDGTAAVTFTETYYDKEMKELTLAETERVEFKNIFKPDDVEEAFSVEKTLSGRDWTNNDRFTFTLTPAQDYGDSITMPADATVIVTNASADHTETFDAVQFHKVGTYVFNIEEEIPADEDKKGVAYDNGVAKVTVEVTLGQVGTADEGTYVTGVTYDVKANAGGTAAAFINTYSATPVTVSAPFVARKVLQGREWNPVDNYIFRIAGFDEAPGSVNYIRVTQGVGGAAPTDKVTFSYAPTFTTPGTYSYYIYERGGTENGPVPGITYDSYAYKVVITVTDNGVGALVADVAYYRSTEVRPVNADNSYLTVQQLAELTYSNEAEDQDLATFTNVYAPETVTLEGDTALHAVKNLLGKAWTDDSFTFQLTQIDGPATVLAKSATKTLTGPVSTGRATVRFDAITFDTVGTYKFWIEELAGDTQYMTYDTHQTEVTVTITDNPATGKLVASVQYGDDATAHHAEYNNIYYNPNDAKDVFLGGNEASRAAAESVDGQMVSAGEYLTFTIDWVNTAVDASGKPAVGDIAIRDTIPAYTTLVEDSISDGGVLDGDTIRWSFTNVAPGASGTVSFQVQVDSDLTAGTDVKNQAYVNNVATNEVVVHVPGKSVTPASAIKVGDILTFTITYNKAAGEVLTITDVLDEGLTYVDGTATTAEGITFEPQGQTLTWSLGTDVSGAGSVSFQAKVNQKAMSKTMTNQAVIGDDVTTNVVTIPAPQIADLTITKTVTTEDGVIAPEAEFSFTVELKVAGETVSGSYPWTSGTASGTVASGETLTLKDGQSLTIQGLPMGTEYTITERAPAGFQQVSPVGNATGTLNADATAAFVNHFTPAAFDGRQLQVYKHLITDFATLGADETVIPPEEWYEDYTFQILMRGAYETTPMPEGTAADGYYTITLTKDKVSSDLPKIAYTAPGTYYYYLREQTPQTTEERQFGVSYSKAYYVLTVTVEEDMTTVTHTLERYYNDLGETVNASVTPEADGVTRFAFHNEFKLDSVNWAPSVTKNLVNNSGATLDSRNFPFTFQGKLLTDGGPIPGDKDNTADKQAATFGAGTAFFKSVTFTEDHLAERTEENPTRSKTYLYRFYEIDGGLAGVTYDDASCFLELEVSMHKGSSTEENSQDALTVNGIYWKQITENNPAPEGAETKTLTYTENDVTYTVEVYRLIYNGGNAQTMHFTNVYDPEDTTAAIPVSKVIQGRETWLDSDSFTFELAADAGVPMPEGAVTADDGTQTISMAVTSADTVTFGSIHYNRAGVYNYRVREVTPESPAGGMTYSTTVYDVRVTVTDAGAQLTAAVAVRQSGQWVELTEAAPLVITNTYDHGSVTLSNAFPVSKAITGRAWNSGDSYTFRLTPVDGAPMPADAVAAVKEVTVTDNRTVNFGSIVYAEPGEYVYTVTELEGTVLGVTYDETAHTFKVIVTDNGDGTMSTQLQYMDGAWSAQNVLTITNRYQAAPGTAAIAVQKTFNGRAWSDSDSFTFTLTPVDGAPMPADDVTTLTIGSSNRTDADAEEQRTASFPAISYDAVGDYLYTVSEVIPADPGKIIYDTSVINVRVHVWDDGSGTLQTTVIYQTGDAVKLSNVYHDQGQPQKTVENSTQKVDGKVAQPGDVLKYTINWVNTTGQNGAKITIVDTIPAGTTYVPNSATGSPAITYRTDSTVLTWDITNVAVGGYGSVSFSVKVNSNPGDEVVNFATINGVKTNSTYTHIPTKAADKSAASIGEEVTFTIGYKNTANTVADIVITDKIDGRLDFVTEKNPDWSYDSGTRLATITIPQVEAGAEGSVTLVAKVNKLALEGEIQNVAVVNDYNTNVVILPKVEVSTLSVTKTIKLVDGQNTALDTDRVFEFTLALENAEDNYPVTIGGVASGTVANGGKFYLKHGQTAVISDLPVGTDYTITETAETGYTASGDLAGTIGNAENVANILNTYDPVDVSVTVDAQKSIATEGVILADKQYSFGLYTDESCSGEPVFVAQNDANGKVTFNLGAFNTVTLPDAPVTYYAKEIPGDAVHIVYDSTVYTVQVTVTDNAGVLEAAVTINGSEDTAMVFTNRVKDGYIIGGFDLTARKAMEGRSLNAYEFGFGVFDSEGNLVGGGTNAADGTITFNLPVAVAASEVPVVGTADVEVLDDNAVATFIDLKDTDILSDEELEMLSLGENVKVTLNVANINDTVSEELKAAVDAAISGETVTGKLFLNLSLTKQIGEHEAQPVSAASQPVTLTFNGMSAMEGNVRLARITDGGLELLSDLDGEGNDTITIQTALFGRYVLIVSTETQPEPTEPEVTEPVVTEPEVTEPEVTEPEVTEPVVTEPEVTEPEVTEPEVTEPEVTEPEVTEPEVTEPEVTEPEVTEPELTEPEVTEPEVTEPEVTEPETTEPEVTEPETTEPEVTEAEPTEEITAAAEFFIIRLSNTDDVPDTVVPQQASVPAAAVQPLTSSFIHVTVDPADTGKNTTLIYYIRELIPEDSQKLGGVTYDETSQYLVEVEVVTENGQVFCKPTYYKADGTVGTAADMVFTNKYSTEDSNTVTFSGKKIIRGDARTIEDGEFTFVLTDANGNTQMAQNDENGGFTFEVGPFKSTGTYTYTITEQAGSDPTMDYDTASYTVQVKVTDDLQGHLVAVAEVQNPVSFTNVYTKPTAVTATIEGTKVLTGDRTAMNNGEFTFVLKENGAEVAQARNNAEGKVTFQVGPFEDPCEHTYTISEVWGTDPNMTYDATVHEVKVTVTLDAEGKLVADETMPEGGVSFTNTYTNPAPVSAVIDGTKVLTGDRTAMEKDEFTFALMDASGTTLTAKNDENGKFTFNVGPFDSIGEYFFTVSERKGADPNMTYDFTTVVVKVKVTMDPVTGELLAEVIKPDTGLTFTNTYTNPDPVSAVIDGTKILTGDRTAMTDGEFTFLLKEGETVVGTAKNDAAGNFRFNVGPYDTIGEHTYTVTEEKGTNPNMLYDSRTLEVKVNVTMNAEGELVATVIKPESGVTFTNTYTRPEAVSTVIEGTKVLTGDRTKVEDGEFTFLLKQGEAILRTMKNDAAGKFSFVVGPFEDEGVYTYSVVEYKGSNPNMTYDATVHEVKVTVTLNAEGKLVADVTMPEGGVSFTNTYTKPEPVTTVVQGMKILTGDRNKPENGEFTFVMKEGAVTVATVKNDASGTFRFKMGPYDTVGEHIYTITEQKGTNPDMTYDSTSYEVKVTVTLNDKGELVANVTQPAGGVTFVNVYDDPAEVFVTLEGKKIMERRALQESEFEFHVIDSSKNLVSVGRNTRDGEIIFKPIRFEDPGVYTLTVYEVQGDTATGVVFDSTRHTVIITVTEKGEDELEAKVQYLTDMTFRNTYYRKYDEYADQSNPKTGDSMMLYLAAWLISGVSLAVLLDNRRRSLK